MRISAAGSSLPSHPPDRLPTPPSPAPRAGQRGFTLLELLVVVGIIAIATAGVAFTLRDSSLTRTEREAQRLAALLESARARSRTLGVAVAWRSTAQGFAFDGLPAGTLPEGWLDADTTAPAGSRLELGPDPIIGAQSLTLGSRGPGGAHWRVATDGLRPFTVQRADGAPAEATP